MPRTAPELGPSSPCFTCFLWKRGAKKEGAEQPGPKPGKGLGGTRRRSERRPVRLGHPSRARTAYTLWRLRESSNPLFALLSLSPSILCKASAAPSSCCRFACCVQPQPFCFSHHQLTFSFILALHEPSKSHTKIAASAADLFFLAHSLIHSFQLSVFQSFLCARY